MLAYVYSRNKLIKDEEIIDVDVAVYDIIEENGVKKSKPPDYLGLNPGRCDSTKSDRTEFFMHFNYMEDLKTDHHIIEFDKMRKEIQDIDKEEEEIQESR